MTQQRSGRRIALLLEYDGTAYSGSQYQDNGPSIQSELEASIERLTGANVRAAFAGRTDAGVHALGQVAAFDIESALRPHEFVRGLNHFLPDDVAVRSARDAERSFDPRRDARNRVYRYEIDTRPVRSPLLRNRAWHVGRSLDVQSMASAAHAIEGTHDFAAFAGAYEGSTRRTLRRCEVRGDGCGRIALTMEAEAFLPHQVRRTAGPLVEVGLGRMTVDDVAALLESAAPSSAQPAAPACGLYLVRVEYGEFAFDEPAEIGNGQDG